MCVEIRPLLVESKYINLKFTLVALKLQLLTPFTPKKMEHFLVFINVKCSIY